MSVFDVQKVATVLVYSGGGGGRSSCPGYVTGRRPGRKAGGTVSRQSPSAADQPSSAETTTLYFSGPENLD